MRRRLLTFDEGSSVFIVLVNEVLTPGGGMREREIFMYCKAGAVEDLEMGNL